MAILEGFPELDLIPPDKLDTGLDNAGMNLWKILR